MKIAGIVIECNYPDEPKPIEAAVPAEMSLDEFLKVIKKLVDSEPDMTSFVITAVVKR
jgi:hypothetical protein